MNTLILLDCDGVLVDNVAFERQVTEYILERLAADRGITNSAARKLWDNQLNLSHGDTRWYDYDFHCLSLGIAPLAREAHENCRNWLRPIQDSVDTVNYLIGAGYRFGVATDAVDWVLKFKLSYFGFPVPYVTLSSTSEDSVKSMGNYWNSLRSANDWESIWYVDNRFRNIEMAIRVLDRTTGVWFDSPEHVLTLPAFRSTNDIARQSGGSDILSVKSHKDLRKIFPS